MWYEERVLKNGKTTYKFYERYKDPLTNKSKKVSISMNTCTKKAKNEAVLLLDKKINSIISNSNTQQLSTLTFFEVCDEYFKHYKATSGNKYNTFLSKESELKVLKKLFNSDVLVQKLNLSYTQKQFDKILELNIAHEYCYKILSLFKNIMRYVNKFYNLENISFIDNITLPRKSLSIEQIRNKQSFFLENSEVKLIINKILEDYQSLNRLDSKRIRFVTAYIIEFMYLNGMRVGELLAIKNENIDFDKKELMIEGTINWKKSNGGYGVKDTTKNEYSTRKININNRSCQILKTLIHENKKIHLYNKSYINRGFIFTTSKGNPIFISQINKILEEAVDKIDSINKKVTTHIFRHSHITLLAEMGIPLKVTMDRVGHNDHDTTLKIYSHVSEKMSKELVNKLENINIV
ncbi:site-specific integrase [Mammaliicoccus sciuri]|uniref:tyrosine-type recombinase/integrase n=1 Tax=Mammaliicoccus sciuri TaxID=1296 RepID=UPI0031FE8529